MRDHRCQLSLLSLSLSMHISVDGQCYLPVTPYLQTEILKQQAVVTFLRGSNFPFTSVDISKVVTILKWHPNQHKKIEISLSHEHSDSFHIDLLMWLRGRAPGTAQQMEDGSSRGPAGPQKHRRMGRRLWRRGYKGCRRTPSNPRFRVPASSHCLRPQGVKMGVGPCPMLKMSVILRPPDQ